MSSLAGVAIMTCLGLGGSQNGSLFANSRGGRKSEVKVLGGLVSSEASLLGVRVAAFFPCPHVAVSPCVSVSSSPLLIGTPVMVDQGPPRMTSWNLMPSFKTLFPNIVTC